MAIYLLRLKPISRGRGQSGMAAAAYRSCEKLYYNGLIYDFSKRRCLVYSEITLPPDAPPIYSDRQTLWGEVEKAEDKSTRWETAQTAWEIVLALPRELTLESNIKLVREFVKEAFVSLGMCADWNVHDDGKGNPHVHIMMPTRTVNCDGFGLKNRGWRSRPTLKRWREQWADAQNRMFMQRGLAVEVDHRSYKDRGIDRLPMIHLGPEAAALERRGIRTARGDVNRAIQARNEERERQERERSRSRGRGR